MAETALPGSVPEFARLRALTAAVHESATADGDAGRADAARAADELRQLRAEQDRTPMPAAERAALFAAMASTIGEIHDTERAAITALAAAAR